MKHAVIVGGGIGGLASAISLAQAGYRVSVLERGDFVELGAGIQLAPNGIKALADLGLGELIRSLGVHIEELRFMDGVSGEHIASMPLTGEYCRRFGNPYVVVHRGELYGALLDKCRQASNVELVSRRSVVSYEQDGTSASAILGTAVRISGDVVIGADGVHSAIRSQLVDDGPPRVSGITVYRSTIPMEQVPIELRRNAVTWWAGPGMHFVHYPIAGGKFLNLAPSRETGATDPYSNVPVSSAHVLEEFSPLGKEAHRLLALGDNWKSWVLVDRDPVTNWVDGRVALLGDAAHPSLHYAAQGACQALEDAVVLGSLLDCPTTEIGNRLLQYSERRCERTAQIQLTARASTKLWHPSGEAAKVRNAVLAGMSASELHDRVAWMHGPKAFDEPPWERET